jgi:hypothetical protein
MDLDPEMAEPVFAVAGFMACGEEEGLADAFAPSGVVIIENFPPFLFEGPRAIVRWRGGFNAHARLLQLEELRYELGQPEEFVQSEDRAFFTLPVRWSGFSMGRPFEERGGWAFVLIRSAGRWRILSYAWAVTSKS